MIKNSDDTVKINLKLRSSSKDYILRSFVDSQIARFDHLIKQSAITLFSYPGQNTKNSDSIESFNQTIQQCQSIIEAITLCFEIYFVQFSLITNNQLQYLVESWKYLKAKLDCKYSSQKRHQQQQQQQQQQPNFITDFSIDHKLVSSPEKLTFFTTKLLKVHKRRLDEELREKFNQIRVLVARAVEDDKNKCDIKILDLYEMIDLKGLLASIELRLSYFEKVGKQSIERAKHFNQMLFSRPKLSEIVGEDNEDEEKECATNSVKYSDFLSDTEAFVASKSNELSKDLALLRIKKWHKELQNSSSFSSKGSGN